MNGDPTKSGSAFGGVFAAALANGGSLDNIQPGLDFFHKLKANGNFNPVESTPATVEKGETPISIDWDYLNAGYAKEFAGKGLDWKVAVPADGRYAQYYSQAINKYAPHPAAARLWEEFLYSPEGQNLWLQGFSRPSEMPAMTQKRHRGPDGRREAARRHRQPHVPDARPGRRGPADRARRLGQGRELTYDMTTARTATRSPAAGPSSKEADGGGTAAAHARPQGRGPAAGRVPPAGSPSCP